MPESEPERPTVEELLAANPKVDPNLVREALDLVEELSEEGIPEPSYNIQSPYQSFPRRS
jgi:hypothetical protein